MIIAKSALDYSLMQRKMSLGADAIEIQLLNELTKYKSLSEAFPNLNECLGIPVYSVHTPLVQYANQDSRLDISLETLVQDDYLDMLENTCEIANRFGVAQNKVVWVVVHSSLSSFGVYDSVKSQLEEIVDNLCLLFAKYEHIGFALENVTPVKNFSDGRYFLANNFLYDNVIFIKYLRKELPLYADKLVTVLDTCHAEMSRQFTSLVANLFDNELIVIPTLEKYFKENAETIQFIHLSKTILNGNGVGRHGQPFSKGDEKYILSVLDYIHKYCRHCDIVLEVAETNYKVSSGFDISNKILRKEIEEYERLRI